METKVWIDLHDSAINLGGKTTSAGHYRSRHRKNLSSNKAKKDSGMTSFLAGRPFAFLRAHFRRKTKSGGNTGIQGTDWQMKLSSSSW